jgi:hypothetical protein
VRAGGPATAQWAITAQLLESKNVIKNLTILSYPLSRGRATDFGLKRSQLYWAFHLTTLPHHLQKMCLHTSSTKSHTSEAINYTQIPVASPLVDGYWLNAFPTKTDSQYPDLIGYGLGFSGKPAAIQLYRNPKNTKYDISCTTVELSF